MPGMIKIQTRIPGMGIINLLKERMQPKKNWE